MLVLCLMVAADGSCNATEHWLVSRGRRALSKIGRVPCQPADEAEDRASRYLGTWYVLRRLCNSRSLAVSTTSLDSRQPGSIVPAIAEIRLSCSHMGTYTVS